MMNDEPKVLVVYSSPKNEDRLRLDIEHKAVERVLKDLHVDSSLVYRMHATTIDDLSRVLIEREYEIVQFSGHGNENGFLFEGRSLVDNSMLVSAKEIAYLLHETSPHLKVAIFMSCFSADSISELVTAAPFVVTVTGSADDYAAIDFIAQFYDAYLRTGLVEKAFNIAQNFIALIKKASGLNVILSRRAIVNRENQVLYQAFPSGKDDSILIDLTEAETDIKSLNVSRDTFLGVLSRKIRVHKWIFSSPRQRVVLPLGSYFGLFSWEDANDVVVCHRILRIKPDIDESTCEAWASLIVAYNNHYMDQHRTQQETHSSLLKKSLDEYLKTYDVYFNTGNKAALLRNVIPEQFKLTKAAIFSNLEMAERKFHQDDLHSTIIYLETALSAIHDLLDQLTQILTV